MWSLAVAFECFCRRRWKNGARITPNYLYIVALLPKRVLLILLVRHEEIAKKLIKEDEVNVHCSGFALSHVVSRSSSVMICN